MLGNRIGQDKKSLEMTMTTDRELRRGGLILLILLTFANASNYLFQFLMGHMLSIEEFGTMNALFSMYAIVSFPFGVVTITTARYVATYRAACETEKIAKFIKRLLRYILFGALGVIVFGIALSPLASRYMNVNNTLLCVFLAITLSVGMFIPLISGAVQGTKQFLGLGILGCGSAGVKVGVAVILVSLGFRLYGVMGALITSNLAMTFVGLFMIRSYITKNQNVHVDGKELRLGWKDIANYTGIAFLINLCIALLSNVDMVFVKRFFSESQAGLYGTAALFGRLVLYIPSGIVLAMFPIAAEAEVDGNGSLPVATRALLYVSGLALLCAAGLNLFPGLAVKLLMGEKFLPAVPYVRLTALMAIPVVLMVTLANYCLAIKRIRMLTLSMSVGCIGCLTAIELHHTSITSIIATISITASVLFVYNLVYLYKPKRITNKK